MVFVLNIFSSQFEAILKDFLLAHLNVKVFFKLFTFPFQLFVFNYS